MQFEGYGLWSRVWDSGFWLRGVGLKVEGVKKTVEAPREGRAATPLQLQLESFPGRRHDLHADDNV